MYDAGDRRFTAVDPVLDSSRYSIRNYVGVPQQLVQYIYSSNNPIIYIDMLGLYFIKKDSSGNYFAVPEGGITGILRTLGFLGELSATASNSISDWWSGYATVGGNSSDNYRSIFQILGEEGFNKTSTWAVGEVLGETVGDVFGVATDLASATTFWRDLQKNLDIPNTDAVVFALLGLAGIDPKGDSLERVTAIMDFAYYYVEYNSWLFITPAYTENSINSFGGVQILPGLSAFNALLNLYQMKQNGKSQKKIDKTISEYWSDYCCGNKNINPILRDSYIEVTVAAKSPVSSEVVTYVNIYKYMLDNYDSEVVSIVAQFKTFMEECLEAYDNL